MQICPEKLQEGIGNPWSRTGLLLSIMPALALVLAACGGGGGGSNSRINPRIEILRLDRDNVVEPGGAALEAAARSEPRQGSVTQGTHATSGVTVDRVRFTNNRVEIDTGDAMRTTETAPRSRSDEPVELLSEDDRAAAFLFTELTLNPSAEEPVTAAFDPTDPITFGLWAYAEDNDDIVWGVFADGLAASLTPLLRIPRSGTATYSGATALAYRTRMGGETNSGFGAGEVRLVADFDSGDVSGTIMDIHTEDDNESFEAIEAPLSIDLEDASIDFNSNGGFFKGEASFRVEPPLTVNEEVGHWGGQFFGLFARNIGGTWGIAGELSGNGERWEIEAVGAFGVTR